MRYSCCLTRRTCVSAVLAFFLAVVAATGSRPASAQPGAGDTPLTYEVQIDGESFEVEGGRPPIKVESKLKKGTTYTLALRVAMIQPLRLNSVQMEYGMSAKVADDKGKDLRIAQIDHELGFSLEITDLGQALDAKHQDELLKTIADAAVKRFTDSKATGLKRAEPKAGKYGPSEGKSLEINFNDSDGAACSCLVFVLSGEKYTVGAVARFQEQDRENVRPWVLNALRSIRPLQP
jgi:hypothetical protein